MKKGGPPPQWEAMPVIDPAQDTQKAWAPFGHEVARHLEKKIVEVLRGAGVPHGGVKRGPEKTRARTSDKISEYAKEVKANPEHPRWKRLLEKAPPTWNTGGREEEDRCLGALRDFSRVSVTAPNAKSVVNAIVALRASLHAVGLKNGYADSFEPPPSSYRDVKLLVWFEAPEAIKLSRYFPETHDFEHHTFPAGQKMLCEIQVLHTAWLENKRATSTAYKIRRAADWETMCRDFGKYLDDGQF